MPLMATAPGDRMLRVDHEAARSTRRRWSARLRRYENPSAAVYGIVITSAVVAVDAGLNVPTIATVESVAGALIIYWLAEAYAHLVAAPPNSGGVSAWLLDARQTLARESPLVLTPLFLVGVLLLTRLAGASPSAADTWALVAGIVLLGIAGARGAIRAGQHGTSVLATSLLGASFGVAAILLKIIIHTAH
jgi:hypothetical protein